MQHMLSVDSAIRLLGLRGLKAERSPSGKRLLVLRDGKEIVATLIDEHGRVARHPLRDLIDPA